VLPFVQTHVTILRKSIIEVVSRFRPEFEYAIRDGYLICLLLLCFTVEKYDELYLAICLICTDASLMQLAFHNPISFALESLAVRPTGDECIYVPWAKAKPSKGSEQLVILCEFVN